MKFFSRLIVMLLLLASSFSAMAADDELVIDEPPQEPPYTSTDEVDLEAAKSKEEAAKSKEDSSPPVLSVKTVDESKNEPKMISHPDAKKGLYLIDRTTGKYYYRVEEGADKKRALSFRVGNYEVPSISADAETGSVDFEDIYGDSSLTFLMFDYDWMPFSQWKQVAVQLGSGVLMAQGNGILMGPPQREAKELYTFLGIPLNLGLSYRFQYTQRPWIAPYIFGGGSYYLLVETRDDGEETHFVGSPAAYGGGGLHFNITAFNRDTALTLLREYGITNLWLTAEFRQIESFSDDIDLSSSVFNFGLTVDY